MADKRKIRASFRKNRNQRARRADWGRHLDPAAGDEAAHANSERISGKGELTRKRTVRGAAVVSEADAAPGLGVHLDVDRSLCRRGRVLSIHGLTNLVLGDDGTLMRCAVRRILKTLNTEMRNVVAVGDHVWVRPVENSNPPEAVIEHIEPRHGCICRTIRGRLQVFVANVDQVAIVVSTVDPPLKPNLIDRMLVTAEKGGVRPLICINKIDLADPAALQPLVGVYAQMGYDLLMLSAATGFGLDRFRQAMRGRETVVAGQSGVGKSSLLNALDPKLDLRVAAVSEESRKGRHTTTSAQLLPLADGGFVVDTPGIRQLRLWDVVPREIPSFFRDLRPYVSLCRFPDCTHTHEEQCAVKDAVADGRIDERRYESYCHLIEDDEELK